MRKKLEKGNLLPSSKAESYKSTRYKKSTKIRDLGRRKSKSEISKRMQATATKGNERFYRELRLKEKAANERMRQLELAGIKSPAYMSVQAQLEMLGKRTKGDRGRRFSETGKATYAEKELLTKILDEFLYGQETSTLKGAKDYMDRVWSEANKNNKLAEAGISREDWFNFWESMPDRKDRLRGSAQNVAIIRAFTIKRNEIQGMSAREQKKLIKRGELTEEQLSQFNDNAFTVKEIAEEIQASKTLKAAYAKIGLTYQEVNRAKIERE